MARADGQQARQPERALLSWFAPAPTRAAAPGDQRTIRQPAGCCPRSGGARRPRTRHRAPDHHRQASASNRDPQLAAETIERLPWAGHLGLRMYEELVAALDPARLHAAVFPTPQPGRALAIMPPLTPARRMEDGTGPAPQLHRPRGARKRSKRASRTGMNPAGVVCTVPWIWGWTFQRWSGCADAAPPRPGAAAAAGRPLRPTAPGQNLQVLSCPPIALEAAGAERPAAGAGAGLVG